MPRMITGSDLREAVEKSTFIKEGISTCAEGVKYDFRLSSRILKASFGRPIDVDQLSETERSNLFVEPGEMVFVLSMERLSLSETIVAELSPKRKLSHLGILAMGGFYIDPLYSGYLLIGLYNFSSTRFPLIPGKKLIAATFYELGDGELGQFQAPQAMDDFPDELIQVMAKYQPVAIQSVQESVQRLRAELQGLRTEIQSRSDWYRRFEESLERHDKQIANLLDGLNAEVQARNRGEDKLSQTLGGLQRTLSWIRGAAWVLAALVGAAVGGFIIPYLFRLLSSKP
jgi:deoxycytidine triphosphate deaminase